MKVDWLLYVLIDKRSSSKLFKTNLIQLCLDEKKHPSDLTLEGDEKDGGRIPFEEKVGEILESLKEEVEKYGVANTKTQKKIMNFLMGQIMRGTMGKYDAQLVREAVLLHLQSG